jgi:oligopeptide transport system substrate-binding protein
MKKFTTLLLAIALMAVSCFTGIGIAEDAESSVFRTLYAGEITTLNYLYTATANEFAVAANVIDTLVEYDKYGNIQPSLAESWEVSEDGTVYTFKLRQDATWVDHNGEFYANVTANDFVAGAKYVLDAQNAASTANIMYGLISGAEAYYMGTSTPEEGEEPYPVMEWDTVGVKAIDDYTVEYTLNVPTPYFLSSLTYVCFMPVNADFLAEKGADFGLATGNDTILYCGAYILSEFQPQEKRVYTANESYWDRENVFIETIEQTYNKEAETLSPELYRRGEIDAASIDNTIASEWLNDPETADLIHPVRNTSFYSYFFCFNFDPQFDAEYEPENWKLAANNEAFRKSFYYGLDRVKAMYVYEPDNPEMLISNTVTLPDFVSNDGVDYIDTGALADITALGVDTFNTELALQYRDQAMEELGAAGATFPVKVLMPYNPSSTGWDEMCVVIEQQLEELLGADYIDIIVEAGPSSGFLTEVRRAGKYAFMLCNWGPDYADPQAYTDPLYLDNSYNFMDKGANQDDMTEYYGLVDAAVAITDDIAARYDAFAEAEAYVINKAYIVPFGNTNGGYTASRIDPFSGQYAPFGISNERYKGAILLDEPLNTDEYFDAYDAWIAERADQ